jgi:hypothetical protein
LKRKKIDCDQPFCRRIVVSSTLVGAFTRKQCWEF